MAYRGIFRYDLAGGEEIIRDVPVYDASTTAAFANGEMLALGGTDPDSDADCGVAFATAYGTTSAKLLGVTKELLADGSTAYNGAFPMSQYIKAIINPFAVYLLEYDQTSVLTATSTSSTTITIGSIEDDIEGAWLLSVTGSPTGNSHVLRRYTDEGTIGTAMPATDAGSTFVKVLPVNHALTQFNAAATALGTTAAAGGGLQMRVVENYINSDEYPMAPLRAALHGGKGALSNPRVYSEIVIIDHIYNALA